MNPKVLNFLNRHRISCLTSLHSGGQPHSSTVHYCHSENPLIFYFLTGHNSRKVQDLSEKPTPASLVIGFSEEEWTTLQLEGTIEITSGKEKERATETFHAKYKNDKSQLDESDLFLKFIPHWWRYAELKRESPVIISSDK